MRGIFSNFNKQKVIVSYYKINDRKLFKVCISFCVKKSSFDDKKPKNRVREGVRKWMLVVFDPALL